MHETERSVRCEQPLKGCPTAAWDQLAFVMTSFHTAVSLCVLNTDFFSLAIWFKFH